MIFELQTKYLTVTIASVLISLLLDIAVITCPALLEPSNGTRFGCSGNAEMNYSTECRLSCNNGHIGSGSAVRTCQHNGTWSGNDFTCLSTIFTLFNLSQFNTAIP